MMKWLMYPVDVNVSANIDADADADVDVDVLTSCVIMNVVKCRHIRLPGDGWVGEWVNEWCVWCSNQHTRAEMIQRRRLSFLFFSVASASASASPLAFWWMDGWSITQRITRALFFFFFLFFLFFRCFPASHVKCFIMWRGKSATTVLSNEEDGVWWRRHHHIGADRWRFGSRLGIPPLGTDWVYTTTWENARWKLGICSGGYRFGSFALWSCGYDYSTAFHNGWMIQPIPFVQAANHLFPLNATPHRKEVSLWNIQDICNFHGEAPRVIPWRLHVICCSINASKIAAFWVCPRNNYLLDLGQNIKWTFHILTLPRA